MSSLVRSLGSWLVAFLRFCVSCLSVRPSVCYGVDNYENENEVRDGGGVGVGIGIGIREKNAKKGRKISKVPGKWTDSVLAFYLLTTSHLLCFFLGY